MFVFVLTPTTILVLGILAMYSAFLTFVYAPVLWRRFRCEHREFRENGACDAICTHCGKNLGFIGTVRTSRKEQHRA